MQSKVSKIQIVVATKKASHTPPLILILRTNERRGQFWQNITGKMEEGETPIEAATRELFEETGLRGKNLYSTGATFEFEKEGKKIKEEVFLCLLDKKEDIKIDPNEHNALQWLEIGQIKENTYGFYSSYESLTKARDYAKENNLPL